MPEIGDSNFAFAKDERTSSSNDFARLLLLTLTVVTGLTGTNDALLRLLMSVLGFLPANLSFAHHTILDVLLPQ